MDMTLKVCRDGAYWTEARFLEFTTLDDLEPVCRIVAIADGTGDFPPMIVSVAPDRRSSP